MSAPLDYTQRILHDRAFRLLLLLPAVNEHQRVECYCLPFDIDPALSYEALSYVWGTSDLKTEILCNGQRVAIGQELGYALTRLRLQKSTRIVWTDAICINQADDEEKSHQIPLMSSIYSLAKRVIVWLGHGDQHMIREAFGCIEFIAEACHRYDRERNLTLGHDERWAKLQLPDERFSLRVCESLKKLYDRPWFSRVWCIQEILLAQDALAIWGPHELTWTALRMATSWIFDTVVSGDQANPLISRLNGIEIGRADIISEKGRYSLLDTLQAYRDFDASDDRDKVYGLLNLVLPKTELEALTVDYSKDVAAVYADTVFAGIQIHSRLTVLAYITHPEEYEGDNSHRSWAPRWDDSAVADRIGVNDDCPWSACGGRQVALADIANSPPGQLCLEGILHDRVQMVDAIMDIKQGDIQDWRGASDDSVDAGAKTDSNTSHPFAKVLRDFVKVSADAEVDEYEAQNQRLRVLARTLTAGCSFDEAGQFVENLDKDAQDRYYSAVCHALVRLYCLQVIGNEGPFAHNPDSLQAEQFAFGPCNLRRIFWTENGSLGLGPQCMDIGDIVVVLYGGNTPYILRPKGDKYLFMGQAYIDNIMHGELLRSLEAGKLQEQTFCLV
jgi:hypothetical protein